MFRALVLVSLAAPAPAADPIRMPTELPPPTESDRQRAEAMVRSLRGPSAEGWGFAPTPAPEAAPEGLPVGTWTRQFAVPNSPTVTMTTRPGGFVYTLTSTDPAGVTKILTIRADYSRSGPTVYGVVTHVEAANLNPKSLALEGAPFAASARVVEGELLVGRVRCDAGESGEDMNALLSGRYRLAAPGVALDAAGYLQSVRATAGWLGVRVP